MENSINENSPLSIVEAHLKDISYIYIYFSKQLFSEVNVSVGGYLPSHEAVR